MCVFAVATKKKKGQSAATMYRDRDSVANFLTATTGDDPLRQARVIDQLKQMRQFVKKYNADMEWRIFDIRVGEADYKALHDYETVKMPAYL